MFKALKELMGAWRDGIAEAKTELAQEAEEKDAKKLEAQSELAAKLETIPLYEQFVTALGAPYRQTYMRELSAAKRDERPAIYLRSFVLGPDEKPETWNGLLDRDFSITDEVSLRDVLKGIDEVVSEAARAETRDDLALWIARAGHVISAGHAVGIVSKRQACELAEPFVLAAVNNFDSWAAYASAFLEGDAESDVSNALSRKFMRSSVKALTDNELSPWVLIQWPTTEAEIDALMAWETGVDEGSH